MSICFQNVQYLATCEKGVMYTNITDNRKCYTFKTAYFEADKRSQIIQYRKWFLLLFSLTNNKRANFDLELSNAIYDSPPTKQPPTQTFFWARHAKSSFSTSPKIILCRRLPTLELVTFGITSAFYSKKTYFGLFALHRPDNRPAFKDTF